MKLKKLLDIMYPFAKIEIYSNGDDNEPLYKGYIKDVPYTLVKYSIYIDEDIDWFCDIHCDTLQVIINDMNY